MDPPSWPMYTIYSHSDTLAAMDMTNFLCDQIQQLYHIEKRVKTKRVVQWVEFRPVKSISDENTDCMDFSRFFSRRNEHQIHISQHQVAKTKQKMPGRKQCSSFSLKNYNSPQLKNYDYVVTYWASTCKYLRSLQAYWPTKKAFFTSSQKTQSYSQLIVNNPTSRTGRPHVTENITIGKSHQFLIAVTQKLY